MLFYFLGFLNHLIEASSCWWFCFGCYWLFKCSHFHFLQDRVRGRSNHQVHISKLTSNATHLCLHNELASDFNHLLNPAKKKTFCTATQKDQMPIHVWQNKGWKALSFSFFLAWQNKFSSSLGCRLHVEWFALSRWHRHIPYLKLT